MQSNTVCIYYFTVCCVVNISKMSPPTHCCGKFNANTSTLSAHRFALWMTWGRGVDPSAGLTQPWLPQQRHNTGSSKSTHKWHCMVQLQFIMHITMQFILRSLQRILQSSIQSLQTPRGVATIIFQQLQNAECIMGASQLTQLS